jgi:ABC-type multidrug transport system fused ATPase/permease subunit
MITVERHSHKRFWLAIVSLAIVAIVLLVAAAWVTNELVKTQGSLLFADSELVAAQTQLSNVETELVTIQTQLDASNELVEYLEATLANLQVNYDRLTEGYPYVLRDPSYQEVKGFLAEDETSKQEYVEYQYTCVDYAADVKANALKEAIRCAYVILEYRAGAGHAIVAFDTTDRGLVFVEPQFDWEVEPEIGKRYYRCVKPPSGHYMTEPGYDDTIMRIVVIW